MPEEKLLFSSSLSALMRTPKKSTREKRRGNRLPIRAICFSFIFSSVLSSLQGYGFSRGLLVLLDALGLLYLCLVFGVILACFLRYHFFYILPMCYLCRLGRFPIRSTKIMVCSLITVVLTGSLALEVVAVAGRLTSCIFSALGFGMVEAVAGRSWYG